uniref:Enoyl-[acyl-carrier-protein] reductase, mitochondrial n=1 Tax=Parascaris univalens TaxID=6257 RepID=A0A915AXK8_PARUN
MSINRALEYMRFGDPTKVLQLVEKAMPGAPGAGQVVVRWIASPVNPLDLNKISGTYPAHSAQFPCIGGSEAMGFIDKVGPGVKGLAAGDKVISALLKYPVWANYKLCGADEVRKVDDRLSIEFAATLLINPSTAYCMLKEFVDLNPGDYIIQNCADSSVGRCVILLAKEWGYKTINTVWDRPGADESMKKLKELGADYVFTDEEFAKEGKKTVKGFKAAIKLALNGVGGPSVQRITSVLAKGASVVTYGGMSLKRHEFSTGSFVFNDLRAFGFAIFDYLEDPKNREKANKMFRWLQDLNAKGGIDAPQVEKCSVDDYAKAIAKANEGGHLKQLIYFDPTYMNK